MKIEHIYLRNFKKFEQFRFRARDRNVLVGPNNAGKSTLLDSLRIARDILRYSAKRKPVQIPVEGRGIFSGHQIENARLSVPIENIVHNYDSTAAEIQVKASNQNTLHIRLHPEQKAQAALVAENTLPATPKQFQRAFPLDLVCVPTLAPLETDEQYVTDETVNRNTGTRLAYRNFRNYWYRQSPEKFQEFRALVREAWPGVDIERPQLDRRPDAYVTMFYTENRIAREVEWSGFGFQIWMQIVTHMLNCEKSSIFVLDEADVYLHPDLQKRLLRIVRGHFQQFLIATHSAEIINESSMSDVVSISGVNKSAKRINSDQHYRRLLQYIGSSENAELARLNRARRIIFFEGNDRNIFKKLFRRVHEHSLLDDPDTLYLRSGGYGQWRRIKDAHWTLREVFELDVSIVSIFDRDFRCQEEVDEFLDQFQDHGVTCFVLGKKEIENFAIHEDAAVRMLQRRVRGRGLHIASEELRNLFHQTLDAFEEETRDNIIGSYSRFKRKQNPKLDDKTVFKDAYQKFQEIWNETEGRIASVPGKDFISALSARSDAQYGCSVTINQLIDAMHVGELDAEIWQLAHNIDKALRR